MTWEYSERVVRTDDLLAEMLEQRAAEMPPSYKEQAGILRRQAQELRNSSSTKTIHFWEEVLPKMER